MKVALCGFINNTTLKYNKETNCYSKKENMQNHSNIYIERHV